MRFEWDPEKNRGNRRDHRIDFRDAVRVFEDPFPIHEYDDRWDYNEDRCDLPPLSGPRIMRVRPLPAA